MYEYAENDELAPFKRTIRKSVPFVIIGGILFLLMFCYFVYTRFRIDVPEKHVAVLIHKTGLDIANADEIAPGLEYKGIQKEVLPEGRYFKNPWNWDWEIRPMPEVGEEDMGVLIRLCGENLGYGEFVATSEEHKGIVPDPLRAGRYPINPYMYDIETNHKPVVIPAGYRGVVTDLSGPLPENPNVFLVSEGFRGVQKKTLTEGTFYLNPYMKKVNQIDLRSQRITISESGTLGFPSKDGFWVTLDGTIEFRVMDSAIQEGTVDYKFPKLVDDAKYEVVNVYVQEGKRTRGQDNAIEVRLVEEKPAETTAVKPAPESPAKPAPEVSTKTTPEKPKPKKAEEPAPLVQIPCPYVGTVTKIHVKPGDIVQGGDPLLTVDPVNPDEIGADYAAKVFVVYNDDSNGDEISEEIISKIILPNTRSFCRLRGSSKAGREFIGGETRLEFQRAFQEAMVEVCAPLGIEIVQALIDRIEPPEKIADPIRQREVSKQKLAQYTQEIEQKKAEQALAVETALIEQKKALVDAEQQVVQITVKAMQEQGVAVTTLRRKPHHSAGMFDP